MKVLAIYIVHVFKSQSSSAASSNQNGENSKIIVMASDLSSVGWFSRGSVQQVMNFTARTVSERTPPGQRSTIDEQEYTAYIFRPVKHPKLSVVTVTDKEYPHRAADCIGPQVISDFTASFRESEYTDISKPQLFWPQLDAKLTQYQQPSQAMDKVAKIQSELDATTEVMHKNIEQVLQRGERLEDLMERTEELDNATKLFVKQAKKANRRCCSMQ
jgi:synaptobrevin family protein YKT6